MKNILEHFKKNTLGHGKSNMGVAGHQSTGRNANLGSNDNDNYNLFNNIVSNDRFLKIRTFIVLGIT